MNAKDLHNEIQELLRNYALKTQTALRSELQWTQSLKKNVDVVVEGETISLEMPEYGIFVEYGRSSGKQPPLNVIYQWCRSKNIDTKYAFPIAKKIGEEGLPPHPFIYIFDESLEELDDAIADLISNVIIDDIES